MEKRSSMKDSGLGSLFRATERTRQSEEQAEAGAQSAEVGTKPEVKPDQGALEQRVEESSRPAPAQADQARRTLIQPSHSFPAVIRVVGVGGAGTNAVNRMLEAGLEGVEFIAINTDAQALAMSDADRKLRIGRELTKGLGGGSDPKVGREAAAAAYDEIKALLKGSDMVFITVGEGGGTGTGAAPVVAEIAKSLGALTIGVVSRPFAFEGKRRALQALEGVRLLQQRADTVIMVPNDKLLEVADRGTSMVEALRLADDVLRQGVQGICDLVTVPGLINLDLADVRTIMTGAATAHMGIGMARGEQRAQKAAEMAVNSSLLETSIEGARGILLNISGGKDLSLHEVNEVAEIINAAADPEATIIFGAVVDEALGDTLWVTVVAAGFEATSEDVLVEQVETTSRLHHPLGRPTNAPGERVPTAVVAGAPKSGTEADAPREAERPGRTRSGEEDDELEVPSFLR